MTCILESCARQPRELHQQEKLLRVQQAEGNHPAPDSQEGHPQLNTLFGPPKSRLLKDLVQQGMVMAFTRLSREESKSSPPEPVARETAIFKVPALPR